MCSTMTLSLDAECISAPASMSACTTSSVPECAQHSAHKMGVAIQSICDLRSVPAARRVRPPAARPLGASRWSGSMPPLHRALMRTPPEEELHDGGVARVQPVAAAQSGVPQSVPWSRLQVTAPPPQQPPGGVGVGLVGRGLESRGRPPAVPGLIIMALELALELAGVAV